MRIFTACCLLALNLVSSGASACTEAPLNHSYFPVVLLKPVDGHLLSGFGMRSHPILNYAKMHTGADYAGQPGTSVHAAAAGEVIMAEMQAEYGNRVVIAHGAEIKTAYAHLSRIAVKEGDCVARGAIIGAVGTTGLVAGPRLHFEVLHRDRFVDPEAVLKRDSK